MQKAASARAMLMGIFRNVREFSEIYLCLLLKTVFPLCREFFNGQFAFGNFMSFCMSGGEGVGSKNFDLLTLSLVCCSYFLICYWFIGCNIRSDDILTELVCRCNTNCRLPALPSDTSGVIQRPLACGSRDSISGSADKRAGIRERNTNTDFFSRPH